MNDSSSFIEHYKEYLFFLYYLGQINRKKNLSLISQSEFAKISLETKRKLLFLSKIMNKATIELDCKKCKKKINENPYIVCDSCNAIFHEHHVTPVKQMIKCMNCGRTLKKINVFDTIIYLSSDNIKINEIEISKIEIGF